MLGSAFVLSRMKQESGTIPGADASIVPLSCIFSLLPGFLGIRFRKTE